MAQKMLEVRREGKRLGCLVPHGVTKRDSSKDQKKIHHFFSKYSVDGDLSKVWSFGKVYWSTVGFHGEYVTREGSKAIMYLGRDREETLRYMFEIHDKYQMTLQKEIEKTEGKLDEMRRRKSVVFDLMIIQGDMLLKTLMDN